MWTKYRLRGKIKRITDIVRRVVVCTVRCKECVQKKNAHSGNTKLIKVWKVSVSKILLLLTVLTSTCNGSSTLVHVTQLLFYIVLYILNQEQSFGLDNVGGGVPYLRRRWRKNHTWFCQKTRVSITFLWSPYVRHSVYNKPRVKIMDNCSQLEHNRKFCLP